MKSSTFYNNDKSYYFVVNRDMYNGKFYVSINIKEYLVVIISRENIAAIILLTGIQCGSLNMFKIKFSSENKVIWRFLYDCFSWMLFFKAQILFQAGITYILLCCYDVICVGLIVEEVRPKGHIVLLVINNFNIIHNNIFFSYDFVYINWSTGIT